MIRFKNAVLHWGIYSPTPQEALWSHVSVCVCVGEEWTAICWCLWLWTSLSSSDSYKAVGSTLLVWPRAWCPFVVGMHIVGSGRVVTWCVLTGVVCEMSFICGGVTVNVHCGDDDDDGMFVMWRWLRLVLRYGCPGGRISVLWGVFVQAPVCLVVTCVSCPSQGLAGGYLCVLSRSGFGQRLPVCLVTVRVWPEATCVSCRGQGLAGGYLLAFCGGTGSDVWHYRTHAEQHLVACEQVWVTDLKTRCGQQPIEHVWTTEQVWAARDQMWMTAYRTCVGCWTGVDCRLEHVLTTDWNRGRTTDYRTVVGYRLEEMLTADWNTFSLQTIEQTDVDWRLKQGEDYRLLGRCGLKQGDDYRL